ncbi:MAG: hypothetical protein ACPIOQ_13255 [Promethearchaeia archaeon]
MEQYGGGAETLSRLVSYVSRILFLPFESYNSSTDSAPADLIGGAGSHGLCTAMEYIRTESCPCPVRPY